jgi:hypothetical protein
MNHKRFNWVEADGSNSMEASLHQTPNHPVWHAGDLFLQVQNEWTDGTEKSFHRACYVTISRDKAVELAKWIMDHVGVPGHQHEYSDARSTISASADGAKRCVRQLASSLHGRSDSTGPLSNATGDVNSAQVKQRLSMS